MSKILLDTNCYSAYLGGDKKVLEALVNCQICYISIFVLGELFAGFKGGNKEEENVRLLKTFLAKPRVSILTATQETAEIFGHLKNELKLTGNPLPINDIWIGAHGMEVGAVIITYDQHFFRIPGLRIWNESRV